MKPLGLSFNQKQYNLKNSMSSLVHRISSYDNEFRELKWLFFNGNTEKRVRRVKFRNNSKLFDMLNIIDIIRIRFRLYKRYIILSMEFEKN
jgi:hypothetical protein